MSRALLVLALLPFSAAAYEPCGVQLHGISETSGAPGTEFVLSGKWGDAQGKKLPVINRGGTHRLEVLSWENDEVRVRVPEGLSPGKYRVGVYCNELSEGGAYSSGFADFTVEAASGARGQEPDEDADFALGPASEEQPTPAPLAGPSDSRHGEVLAPMIARGSFRFPLFLAVAVIWAGLRRIFRGRNDGIVKVPTKPKEKR